MKKYLVFAMILSTILLTSCGGDIDRVFYPGGSGAQLYYNSFEDVKNTVKREDVKRNGYYNDLFLSEGVQAGMKLSEVLFADGREAMLDVSSKTEVFFMPKATGSTKLTEWINQSTIRYTFGKDGLVKEYEIVNSKSNNTYTEYLFVMRALGLKYGECTTEIYKDEDNIINNTKIKEDHKEVENIIAFFEDEFANGNIGIISQWINDDHTITVEFLSPDSCKVIYDLNPMEEIEGEVE